MPFEINREPFRTTMLKAFDPATDTPATVLPENHDLLWIAAGILFLAIIGGWYLYVAWRRGKLSPRKYAEFWQRLTLKSPR